MKRKGPSWVRLPAPPEDHVRQLIYDAVSALGVGDEKYTIPVIENMQAQWTGFRAHVPRMESGPWYRKLRGLTA